ncbi:MAG: GNAT family N-acetyltransferase [Thermoplasmata archaeon]
MFDSLSRAVIRLQPVDDVAFEAFLQRAISRRAERWVRRGIWTPEAGLAASREAYAEIFPQGRLTAHQQVCDVVESDTGARVGDVWYSTRESGGKVDFEINWLGIEPGYRRRGYATRVLGLLEAEARSLGAERTRLTVWMDNPDARRLYHKLGYTTQTVGLVKSVETNLSSKE